MVSNGGGDVGGMWVGMGVEMLRQALNIYIVTLSARQITKREILLPISR